MERPTMAQPLLFSYGAISFVATMAYLAWGWLRAGRDLP